jgi:hypothetical protein
MRHRSLALAAVLLLLGLSPGSALGATLDQYNTATPTMASGAVVLAQTVTAGLTGKLSQVDLMVEDLAVGGGTMKIQIQGIQRAPGYPPSSTVLAQGSAHISKLGWYSFALSPAISVLAGGRFAIVVSVTNMLIESSGDTYSGGQLWEQWNGAWVPPSEDYDLEFKTYMTTSATPSPAPKKTPAPTAAPKPTPTASATATAAPTATSSPTPSVASAAPSGTAEIAAAATPPPTASASQGQPSGPLSNGATDWTLPALAAVVALLVLAAGVAFTVRRRRQPGS